MLPGPYSVCRIAFPAASDAAIYTTVKYGYDSAEHAFKEIPELAKEEGIPIDDLVVIKFIDKAEVRPEKAED